MEPQEKVNLLLVDDRPENLLSLGSILQIASGFTNFLPPPIYKKTIHKMVGHLFAKQQTPVRNNQTGELVTRHSILEEKKHSLHILKN